MTKNILLTGNSNHSLAEHLAKLLKIPLGKALISQFSDGETRIEIEEDLHGKDVFILQSTSVPVNHHLIELLLMSDAVKRSSANSITAIVPYFGYARQDKRIAKASVPISAKVSADLIGTVGIDRLLTLDLHSEQIQGFFNIPIENLPASKIFIEDIHNKHYSDPLIVSPDVGGVVRARALAKGLNNADLAIVDKRRSKPNVAMAANLIGTVKDRSCIIVDDLIDTGGTLALAAKVLKEQGAKKIVAYVTHPVLSNDAIQIIQNSALEELVVTDTIPLNEKASSCAKIRQLSVAPLLLNEIQRK